MSWWERTWTGFFARLWDARASKWDETAHDPRHGPLLEHQAIIQAHNARIRAQRLREQQRRA